MSMRVTTILILILLALGSQLAAMERCLICHGKPDFSRVEETGRKVSLYIDTTIIAHSAHASRLCTDCHVDITTIPHTKHLEPVNCRRCHYAGNPVGAPQGELYDQYAQSVHGQEVMKGNPKAPICQDCHGAHDIQKHDSPTSRMANKMNRPKACGTCHIEIYATYRESVHGVALLQDSVMDSPDCSNCHGEHNIRRPTDTTSQVSPGHVSQTCGECHGPMGVATKYGIKSDRTATFEDSFHGIAHQMENRTVANCASCHGFHDIRPQDDPKSSININNIVKTCGQSNCHPEATVQFASGQIHVDPHNKESGLVYYITKFFTILTIGTLAGLFVFIALDLFRRAQRARGGK